MLATFQFTIFCLPFSCLKLKIHKTIILHVVLFGCETWFLIQREEHELSMFQNRVLRRIFGPKREEEVGGWRRLHRGAS
jgi:hypothetical protein